MSEEFTKEEYERQYRKQYADFDMLLLRILHRSPYSNYRITIEEEDK